MNLSPISTFSSSSTPSQSQKHRITNIFVPSKLRHSLFSPLKLTSTLSTAKMQLKVSITLFIITLTVSAAAIPAATPNDDLEVHAPTLYH